MTSAQIIAELVRKHVEGMRLAIHHPLGERRYIAEIYATDRGFVFADIGWDDSLYSGHPFHVVEGTAAAGDGGQVCDRAHRRGAPGPAQRRLPGPPGPRFGRSGGPRRGALA